MGKILSTKHQIPNKSEALNPNDRNLVLSLEHLNLEFVWSLEIRI
jgi:hypothetical protein